jgi:hypothetical protein
MSENEIKNVVNVGNKALEDKLYDKYLEIWKEVKSNLNKTMDKKQIKSDKLQKLIKSEIEKLSKMNDLKGFKLLIVNNKPIGVYKNEKEIYFTTISMCIIKNKNDPKLIEIFKSGTFEMYKKENRIFVKFFHKGGVKKFSDKRLFIFNFNKINRLDSEIRKIKNGVLKERKTKNKKEKNKLKSIEL